MSQMASSSFDCFTVSKLSIDHERVKNAVWATLDLAVGVELPWNASTEKFCAMSKAAHKQWIGIRMELLTTHSSDLNIAAQAAVNSWLDQATHRPGQGMAWAVNAIRIVLPICQRECYDRHVRDVPAMLEEAIRCLQQRRKMVAWVCQRAPDAPKQGQLALLICRTLGLAR